MRECQLGLSQLSGTIFYYSTLFGLKQKKQYWANYTPVQWNGRLAITDDDGDWLHRSTTMVSLISINQAAGPLGALIEWLCVVVEKLAGDGGWQGTDNGLQ